MPTDTRVRAMTKQEIDFRRENMALGVLARSGVGGIYAHNALGSKDLETVMALGLAGSETEAIVKLAIQFAFTEMRGFQNFIDDQRDTQPHLRKFRVVR